MSDNKFTRTGSGTYRLDGMGTPVTTTRTPGTGLPPASPQKPATGNNPAFQPQPTRSGAYPAAAPARSAPAAPPVKPGSGSQPAHVPGSSPSSPTLRTPARGLPNDPMQRALFLGDLARKDLEAERWASAESNLLLALTWDAGNAEYKTLLEDVRRIREDLRKNAPKRT